MPCLRLPLPAVLPTSSPPPSAHPARPPRFDGGDTTRFVFPQAWVVSVLALARRAFPGGFAASGADPRFLQQLRWAADFLAACRYAPGQLVAYTSMPGEAARLLQISARSGAVLQLRRPGGRTRFMRRCLLPLRACPPAMVRLPARLPPQATFSSHTSGGADQRTCLSPLWLRCCTTARRLVGGAGLGRRRGWHALLAGQPSLAGSCPMSVCSAAHMHAAPRHAAHACRPAAPPPPQGADILSQVAAALAAAAVTLNGSAPANETARYLAVAQDCYAQAVQFEGLHSLNITELQVGVGAHRWPQRALCCLSGAPPRRRGMAGPGRRPAALVLIPVSPAVVRAALLQQQFIPRRLGLGGRLAAHRHWQRRLPG